MIKIYHLTKSFPAKGLLFDELALRVAPGELLFLTGSSGVGKSCLLRIIAGMLRPDSGQVVVTGRNLETLDESGLSRLRREVALVPQEPLLLASRSVAENVSFALRARGATAGAAGEASRRWLDNFSISELSRARPADLSRGEQFKVMLARALAGSPKVLLVDEPAASLDAESLGAALRLIAEENSRGMTVVVTAKDGKPPGLQAPRAVELEKGKAVERP